MISSPELLESRIAPAGIITLSFSKTGILLTGDDAANDLAITQNGAEITLTPQNGTTILNKTAGETVASSDPVTLRLLEDDLAIDMGKGGDLLTLTSLTLPFDLYVKMGLEDTEPNSLTISNLTVGGDLYVESGDGTVQITGDLLRVAYDATFFSAAHTFTIDVESFYVGDDLDIDASISTATDSFKLNALDVVVYDNFTFVASVFAEDAPADAVSLNLDGLLNVGGNLHVLNDSFGQSNIQISAGVVVLSEKVLIENRSNSISETLNFSIDADILRLDGGLSFSSKSPANSNVSLVGDLVLIDGPVATKLVKSGGSLIILSNTLQIEGSVGFATKGEGLLRIEGAGDIFGKVSASFGSGVGEVTIKGTDQSPLNFNGLVVTAPAKLAVPNGGIDVTLDDVSLYGKVALTLGRGADTVNINDSVLRNTVLISTGASADEVNIHTAGSSSSIFRSGLTVALGDGDDKLVLGRSGAFDEFNALLIYGPANFNGGLGTDTYTADARNLNFYKSLIKKVPVLPIVRAVETRN